MFSANLSLLFILTVVYGHDLRMYKSMYGSISHWQWYGLNSDVVDGVILTVTYYKQFADTGLRLTASGTHTISNYYTARWSVSCCVLRSANGH